MDNENKTKATETTQETPTAGTDKTQPGELTAASASTVTMRVGKGEPIFRILFALIIAVIFLGFPYVVGFWASELLWIPLSHQPSPRGYWIPLFNLTVLNSLWVLVLLWTIVSIIGEIVKLVISQYNRKYALTTTIANGLILIFTGILFLNPRIMNTDFVPLLNEYLNNTIPNLAASLLKNANILIFVVVLIVIVVESIMTWVKAAKYS